MLEAPLVSVASRQEKEERDAAAENIHNMLTLFGPAFVRTKRFWVGVGAAVIAGLVLGGVALGFFNLFEEVGKLLWCTDEYKNSTKHNSFVLRGRNATGGGWGATEAGFFYVPMAVLGGLAVGAVKLLWTGCFYEFPSNPPALFVELKDLQCHHPSVAIPVLLCSAIGLACGASVGPEAALGAAGAALGTVMGRCLKSDPTCENREGLFPLIGMAASFGPLLPSPILAVMLLHELGFASLERSSRASLSTSFMEMVALTGVGASVSFALFTQLKDLTFLETVNIPPAEIGVRGNWTKYLAPAMAIGFLSGIVGFCGILFLGIGKKLGDCTRKLLARTGMACGCGRYIGMILTPAIGGGIFGLIAHFFPMTLGDGNAQLGVVIGSVFRQTYSANYLIALAFAKLAALGVALGFGFIGGQIFPMVFAGACVGVAVTQITGLTFLVSVPCALVAVPCAFTPCIFSLVGLVSVMLALGGAATGPPFVAAIVSYCTVSGVGIIQRIMQRQLERLMGPEEATGVVDELEEKD